MDVVTTLGESVCAVQLVHAAKSWWPRARNSLSSHLLGLCSRTKTYEVSSDSVGREKGLLNSCISAASQRTLVSSSTCSFYVCGLARGAKSLLWNSSRSSSLYQTHPGLEENVHPPPVSLAQGQGWASPSAKSQQRQELTTRTNASLEPEETVLWVQIWVHGASFPIGGIRGPAAWATRSVFLWDNLPQRN